MKMQVRHFWIFGGLKGTRSRGVHLHSLVPKSLLLLAGTNPIESLNTSSWLAQMWSGMRCCAILVFWTCGLWEVPGTWYRYIATRNGFCWHFILLFHLSSNFRCGPTFSRPDGERTEQSRFAMSRTVDPPTAKLVLILAVPSRRRRMVIETHPPLNHGYPLATCTQQIVRRLPSLVSFHRSRLAPKAYLKRQIKQQQQHRISLLFSINCSTLQYSRSLIAAHKTRSDAFGKYGET